MATPIVALVGRPNVGKSTLFNRIAGSRLAIVEDIPGTTRDRLYAEAEWTAVPFTLVDTGGIDLTTGPDVGEGPDPLSTASRQFRREIREQAQIAIDQADAVIFLVDAREGVTGGDEDVAEVLRRSQKPVILAANKADNQERRLSSVEFYELGLGEPHAISAIHGAGVGDLLDEVLKSLPVTPENEEEDDTLKLAIIGRPNVGKSSLLNALLGQERAIVSDIAGTTRDAIDTRMVWDDEEVVLIDTAGIRRRGRVEQGIEKYSVMRAMRAIQRSDVVILVIDAVQGVTAQDAHVASYALDELKGLLVVVNKWDLVEKDTHTMHEFTQRLRSELKFMDFAPLLFISALTKQRIQKVIPIARHVQQERNVRIPTSDVNRIVQEAVARHKQPSKTGRQLRFYYATQAKVAPPTFVFFVNDAELVHFTYQRFLENQIRAFHPFEGTPIKMVFRNRSEE